ncbi:MAG: flavodoxin-dependent (E)-4-hydroxy-3-methylbut-2-enyl-diphosphate synthase [Fusobacteriaceae bacterium]|nr:flavodoxin-dependent (E)-4-hydroxy-3-methylbut-2-enyl-diphosphate synthase [Fusobacteriaceae bacterium]MBN2839218.1 flavodoxin-dependent (E)-4-hydroxy-3-methylbut-2-enyl-diphosphate synthase [Fusobacteriaceae bacterium]
MGINTKKINVGNLSIGGSSDVVIQSMTNTKTSDVLATINQILELEKAGCQLVRVTVNDMDAAKAIKAIKEQIHIPLVADIHFDYRLAIEAIENGIDKLRINPGNIGDDSKVEAVVKKAKEHGVPIRIGVNGGSLEKSILAKYGHPTSEALVESAMYHISLLEKFDFTDIIVSIKASNVKTMTKAYKIISEKINYPLHLGVTEAGTTFSGTIKSSIGIGSLLLDDIGDTIRVSLTANPVEEIKVAKEILKVLDIRKEGPEFISCPTCGRTEIDLIGLANEVEAEFSHLKNNIKIAVMGCVVNGPGEAKEADFGIAGGKGYAVIFKKGEIVKKVEESEILSELRKIINEELKM